MGFWGFGVIGGSREGVVTIGSVAAAVATVVAEVVSDAESVAAGVVVTVVAVAVAVAVAEVVLDVEELCSSRIGGAAEGGSPRVVEAFESWSRV